MLKNNIIYIKFDTNYYGYLDTGGGFTFFFRNKELAKKLKIKYLDNEKNLDKLPENVIIFIGNDYFKNKIYLFDYLNEKFNVINDIPKNLTSYTMFNKNQNFAHIELYFIDKNVIMLFDTGAQLSRKNKLYAISFLDGIIFDKIKNNYKIIDNYDDDGSPCIIIPEIIIFNKKIKNIKFLRRSNNAFLEYMTGVTGINHIGAIGGNILKKFKIICDFKNKKIYI